MKTARRAWVLYGICLVFGLGMLLWLTVTSLRMERNRAEAELKTQREEKIHMALWYMDYTFAFFLNPESARPHDHYKSLRTTGEKGDFGLWSLSPLILSDDFIVRLRFQVDARGRFSSPLVPSFKERSLVERYAPDADRLTKASGRLEELQANLNRTKLVELMLRQGAVLLTKEQVRSFLGHRGPNTPGNKGRALPRGALFHQGAYTPVWHGDSLLLVRQVLVGDEEYLQGCWLDWPLLKETLMSSIRHLLPKADLLPTAPGHKLDVNRQLNSLPIRLVPGSVQASSKPATSRMLPFVALSWCGALLIALMAAWLLHQSLQLGERRSAFVSTVSHELRTPLTTFRMYSEMLMLGMVPQDEMKPFFTRLLAEADRLDHLLKNVLAYARIEHRPSGAKREDLTVTELLDRLTPRLIQRATQAGMVLQVYLPDELAVQMLSTDPSVIDQILFNMVDNACKYAAGAEDRTIHLSAQGLGRNLHLFVRDHGSGIPEDHPKLFEPFSKAVRGPSRSIPGVGLGLALCRRLARQLGGDLELDRSVQDGACFSLRLPMASN